MYFEMTFMCHSPLPRYAGAQTVMHCTVLFEQNRPEKCILSSFWNGSFFKLPKQCVVVFQLITAVSFVFLFFLVVNSPDSKPCPLEFLFELWKAHLRKIASPKKHTSSSCLQINKQGASLATRFPSFTLSSSHFDVSDSPRSPRPQMNLPVWMQLISSIPGSDLRPRPTTDVCRFWLRCFKQIWSATEGSPPFMNSIRVGEGGGLRSLTI